MSNNTLIPQNKKGGSRRMFSIFNFTKRHNVKKEEVKEVKEKKEINKDTAKERLHLVLMQDRANVSADFLDLMKQEIIDVIKKYVDINEDELDVKLTNKINTDGTTGAPALYANIPIMSLKSQTRKLSKANVKTKNADNKKTENKKEDTSKAQEVKKEDTKKTQTPKKEEAKKAPETKKVEVKKNDEKTVKKVEVKKPSTESKVESNKKEEKKTDKKETIAENKETKKTTTKKSNNSK